MLTQMGIYLKRVDYLKVVDMGILKVSSPQETLLFLAYSTKQKKERGEALS